MAQMMSGVPVYPVYPQICLTEGAPIPLLNGVVAFGIIHLLIKMFVVVLHIAVKFSLHYFFVVKSIFYS